MNTNANGGELAMMLTQDNGGTRLSSTRYVYYGTITTTCRSFSHSKEYDRLTLRYYSEDREVGRCRNGVYHNE